MDIDGLLTDFHAAVGEAVAKRTGFRLSVNEMSRWSMSESLSLMGASEDVISACSEIMASEGFNTALIPNPEAKMWVPKLKQIADIQFVTSPQRSCKTWMVERIGWMRANFSIEPSEILFADDKSEIRGDVFVDDNPMNVAKWRLNHNEKIAVVWDAPYNRKEETECLRVFGWAHLASLIAHRE